MHKQQQKATRKRLFSQANCVAEFMPEQRIAFENDSDEQFRISSIKTLPPGIFLLRKKRSQQENLMFNLELFAKTDTLSAKRQCI